MTQGDVAAETPSGDSATPRAAETAARRRRLLEAAIGLASEGGYDAVQMRDVATRAQVALGTIYRYFSSKDHLLAASLVTWTNDLERRIARPMVLWTRSAAVAPSGGRAANRAACARHSST